MAVRRGVNKFLCREGQKIRSSRVLGEVRSGF